MSKSNFKVIAGGALCAFAIACSNGGGDDDASTPPSNQQNDPAPVFTSGVFAPSSTFKDQCETVRTGTDLEGFAFTDEAGSLLEEKFWLRSWTNETYLWNDEVVDQNPSNFGSATEYFDVLKTLETTSSGAPKDDFHFSINTEEYLEELLSEPLPDYGARFVFLSTTLPRDLRVLYTDPNTPASAVVGGQTQLVRGTRMLEADGVDIVNGGVTQAEIDILDRAFAPQNAGEQHTFVVQNPGSASTRTITLTAADIATQSVNRFGVINTGTGDVGYLLINTLSPFSSEADIVDAFTNLQSSGVSDLILDLRYNGGGLLDIASQISYMVAGASATNGRVFEAFRFNDDAGNLNPATGEANTPDPFYDTTLGFSLTAGTPLPSLNLSRVFILTTEETCSGSESIINALRGINIEVILIGRPTCGKPFGFFPEDNCGETYFTIQFQGVNDQGFGDYADGFIAANSNATNGVRVTGCAVADDLDNELGDSSEALLAAALQYRATNTCPTAPAALSVSGIGGRSVGSEAFTVSRRKPAREALTGGRDMTSPK
ncbi:MAG: S41 family peptidase [Pseudomonadota bacterium]